MGKFRRQSWLAYALLLVSACDGGGGQTRGAGGTDAGPGADARGGGGNATDVGRGGGGGGGGSAGAGGGSAGGGGEPPRPDGGMPAKDAGGPLPAALTPVVRFDGCRGYSCELVVPQGMTAAYAWHLDGAVLPDRRSDGAPIDRHAQVLDTAFLDTRGALTCSARLADARGLFGPAATSEPMTFAPLRPSVAEVVLSPREPAPTDELHCQPAGARYGACADVPTFEYRWTADDVELPRANTDHLQAALPVGTVVRCHARPLGLGVSGDEVASNDVTMPAVARGVPNVRAEFTDDPAHPVRCAFVQDMGAAPGVTWWWQINDRAAFPASAALTADQVASCDRLRCWAVLPTGVRTLRAEVQAPLGEGCPAADDCGSPACHPAGGCARTLLGGGECVVGGCAVDGRCDAGRCVARIDPCDDHEPCTLDTCDAEGGCAHTPADAVPCDDGDPCTEGDRCNAGSCGGRRTCGGCRADADCDDANPCTVDRCSAAECAYAPGEGECSDGDACTENDACVDGLCRGTAVDCDERFVDVDGDGYGVTPPEGSTPLCACDAELRPTAPRGGDCDDADPALHPDAVDLPDDGIDTDCDGQEQFGEATVSIGPPGGGGAGGGGGDAPPAAPDEPAPITGDFDFGPVLGDHPAEGEVTRSADGASWCVSAAIHQAFDQILTLDGATVETCQGPDGVRHSTVRGAARIAGIPVTVNGSIDLGEVLDYELDITGEVSFQGASAPALAGGSFASRRNGAIQWGIRATLQGLTFAPGFSLGQTELSFGPVGEDALPGLSLSSILNLGQAPTGLSLAVNGILTLDGAGDLSLSLAPGTRWQPFGPRVPLGTFEALSGGLHLAADGTVSADFDLGLATEFVLVRGALALTDASVSGSVDQNGAFEVSLSGTTEITVGAAEPVSVRVVGTLENGDVLSLTGEIDGPVEPLAAIAGDDALVLEGTDLRPFLVGLTLDLTDRTLSASVDVPATMTLLPGPDQIELTTFVHGEATFGAAAPQWLFQAIVDEITLPVLGTLPSVAVIAATDDTAEVDLFRNGEIVRDVPGGITLAVQGDAPFSLPGLDSVLFILQVARNGRLSIEADLGISAMFIRPDDDVPGVESMELTRLALTGSIQGARVTLSIESNVELQPDNQDEPLQGFTSLQFSPATQEFGGTIALTGRWTEPMSLRNFAFQNPAFTMAFRINLETGIPTVVITRLGWNLDIFWKKSGDWPVDGLDPDSESTPENVLKVGNTFLFDVTPTPSGLCVIGACIPLPPMAVRFDLRNLTSDDLITVINDIVQGLVGFFGDAVPDGDLPAIDLDPFSLAVHTMRFQASTHTMDFYGQPLVAGIFATLDATLNRVDALFEGHLSPDGLLLHGETDAIWLPHIELSGDPFQRELRDAAPRTMSTRDLTFNPGGFEAFVGVSDCNQERRIFGPTAGDGVSLSLGACDAAGKMPLAARIMSGGQTRTVTTEATIPRDGLAHHVALQISGRDVAMYADSDRLVVASDSAPDIAPGTISVATIGAPGITTLDDIRFWNGATRSTAEIVSQARVLPTRYMNPNGSFAASPLMRRYEFDFDTGPDSARNAREGLRSPYPLTGAGGRLEAPAANPVRFLLDVPSPLAGAPRLPSFGIDAGMSLYLPFLPDPSIKVAVEAKLGDQGNRFRFRTNPIGFLPIPGPDGLLGTFYVTGRGRNLVDDGGGYDDGIYGEIDLESLYLSGSASLEWHDADGSVTRFIEGTMAFDQATEYFSLDTSIDWTVPLGDLGDIGVRGRAAFNPDPLPAGGSPENKLLISGDVILFDESFAGVEVAIDGTQMSFEADWRGSAPPGLGIDGATLAAASVKYVVDFVNSTACGNATVQVGAGTCQIQLCFEPFPAAPTVTGSCSLDCGDDVCGLGDPLGTHLGLLGVETCGRDDGGSRCNSDCGKCLLAGPCTADADCASNNCWGDICVTSVYCGDTTCGLVGIPLLEEHCGYRREDNGCQEDCGLCQIGDTCTHDRDCVTGRCSGGLIKTCEPRCGDGVCTAAREFCGANNSGSVCRTDCGQCGNGTPCVSDAVCSSGYCAGVCAEDPCGRNGCEWIPGIEWCGAGNGGPECQRDCDLCEGGMTCNGNSDCQTGSCVVGLCTYCGDGQCEDNILTEYCGSGVNGTTCETDCNLCQNGHVCDADADCDSGYCLLGVCTESPCGRNGCEWIPGIEWCGSGNGGPECERDCGLCNTGDTCDGDADCETNNCIGFVCGPERRNCGDGRCVNIVGIEVCGGSDEISPLGYADCERDCGTCGMGEPCDRDNDCDEGECLNAFEGAPGLCAGCGDGQCTWPIENCGSGNGGGVCQSDCGKCGLAGFCDEDSDCRSGSCAGFICLPSCGDGSCSDGETCGASDLHCRADCGLCGDGTWCARDSDCVNWCRVRSDLVPRCGSR